MGPPRKSWLRLTVGAAALIVALELASFVAAWVVEGRAPGWSYWQRERDLVMRGSAAEIEIDRIPSGAGAPRVDVVHPFVGYVGDPTVTPSVNELGFEGRTEPIQVRARGRIVIGVLGGSTAADFAARAAEQLERRLAGVGELRGREVVVVNLARDGYKQPQQLMALSYVLSLGGQFDAVVNIDGLNEVASHEAGNATKGVFPVYPRDWYLATSHVPDRQLRRLMGRRHYLEEVKMELAATHSRKPLRYSMTWNLLWRTRHRVISRRHADVEHSIAAYRTASEEYVPYRTTGPRSRLSMQQTYELLVDVWKRGSLLIDGLCRENGIRYVHFLQPGLRVDPSTSTITAEHAERIELARAMILASGRRLQELGIAFTDLGQPDSVVGTPVFEDGGRALDASQLGLVVERTVDAMRSAVSR